MATVAERLAVAQATVEVLNGTKAPTIEIRSITLTPNEGGGYTAAIDARALNGSVEVDAGSVFVAVPPSVLATITTLFNGSKPIWKGERGLP